MCQSVSEGGRRCAAHTRRGYEVAVDAVSTARGPRAIAATQVAVMDAAAAHASTPTGAREIAQRRAEAEADGDVVLADFLASAQNVARAMDEARASVEAQIAALREANAATTLTLDPDAWDPGTPSVEVGEHWSIAEGGDRWHAGGCGAFAMAMVERWPHLKIACEMYNDHGAESVAHAWAYDPTTGHRFHIFGAEKWEPTTRPDYDPDSHRVLLDQSPGDVRRLFRGFNTSEDHVFDALEVACEMFDPAYEPPEDDYDRNHLYF